jgi:hypothetical protein
MSSGTSWDHGRMDSFEPDVAGDPYRCCNALFKKKLILPALNELFVEVGFIYGILWLYETYILSMVMLLFVFCCYILYNETTT